MMRKLLISLAVAASALAVASPASAQWAPVPQHAPGYGYGYGQGYGYGHAYGHVYALQARIDGIQRQIRFLDSRNILSNREAYRLRNESLGVERRLRSAARYGLNPYEAYDLQARIARLEQHVHREAIDRNGRWGRGDRRRDDRWDRDGRWSRRD